jgi:hypothetical protein
MSKRWTRVGLLGLAIFVINGISRFVTWKLDIADESEQLRLGLIAVGFAALLLVVASIWWAIRYPFGRLFADVAAAVGIGALLSLLIGPFLGGSKPFADGLDFFVGQMLLFLAIAALGVFIGFVLAVALGKDWKSRGLKSYSERIARRRHKQLGHTIR